MNPHVLVMLLFVVNVVLTTAARAQADFDTNNSTSNVYFDQRIGAQIPLDAMFVDDSGRTVTLEQVIDGKPSVLILGYNDCPMLCDVVLNNLAGSLKQVSFQAGAEYRVVDISIDPREDASIAARKRKQVTGQGGPTDGWAFLTGTKTQIDRVATSVGFGYRFDEPSGTYAHAAGVVVLTPDGRASRYLLGLGPSSRDLRLALVEAGDGRIGSVVDQALLTCFRYNPESGGYGFYVIGALRLAGLLTVAILLGAIMFMAWRYRRRAIHRDDRTGHDSSVLRGELRDG